jgi:hypothetical protein
MFRIVPAHRRMIVEFDGRPESIQAMIDDLTEQRRSATGDEKTKIEANIAKLKTKLAEAKKAKWGDDGRMVKEDDAIKVKNHIEHLKGLISQAPAEDKVKLREILKSEQAKLKKLQGGKIDEGTKADSFNVHLQSAHDSIASDIANAKKRGEPHEHLEKRRKAIAAILDSKD